MPPINVLVENVFIYFLLITHRYSTVGVRLCACTEHECEYKMHVHWYDYKYIYTYYAYCTLNYHKTHHRTVKSKFPIEFKHTEYQVREQ